MEQETKTGKTRLRQILFVLFWLLVWEAADRIIDNHLVLSGPIRVVEALWNQMEKSSFWITCGTSFARIVVGFLAAFVVGLLLGILAHWARWFRELIAPVMSLLKSVPMVSFVIMLLIWVGNQALTVYLAFLIVLPLIYTSTLSGLQSVDPQMLEMAKVYRLSPRKKLLYLYRPAVMPYLISTSKVSLGMSWKAGIMAEVLATPDPSIGREMYEAKSFLQTADLFAWTIVVILLSLLFEKIFLLLMRRINVPMKKGAALGH